MTHIHTIAIRAAFYPVFRGLGLCGKESLPGWTVLFIEGGTFQSISRDCLLTIHRVQARPAEARATAAGGRPGGQSESRAEGEGASWPQAARAEAAPRAGSPGRTRRQ